MKKENKQGIIIRVLILNLSLFFGAVYLLRAQPLQYKRTPFKDGEVLLYKVKWGFIRLGTVKISQQIIEPSFSSKYMIQLRAKSTNFKSVLDADSPTNSNFFLEESKGKKTITGYRYDGQRCLIIKETWENGSLAQRTSLFHEDAYFDVLGLIMMMRCLSASDISVTLPTIVDFTVKDTDLNFIDGIEEIKVSALDRPTQARRVEGNFKWKAWGGISGPFKGWFSNDEAAIPLKIHLNVSLGSICLELERFHRPDWVGPDVNPRFIQNASKEVSKQ